jgi:hypothetical protein
VNQEAGEKGEDGQVQGLGGGEEREHGPTGGRGDGAVDRENGLNPIAGSGPVDDAGDPAAEKAASRAALTGRGNQEGGQRERGQQIEVEARERNDQQKGGENSEREIEEHGGALLSTCGQSLP